MAKLALDSGRHAYSERADDLYETPPAAVLALLGAESLPRCIWERAAGRGAIVEVVRSTGHDVVASDLRDRGDHRCPGTTTGIESFNTLVAPDGDRILTNPPFRKSGPQPFVSHGLKLCRCVIILARLTFIESKRPILESGTWVRAMPFKSRLPMMDRDHANRTLVISLEGSGTFSDFKDRSDKSGSSISFGQGRDRHLGRKQAVHRCTGLQSEDAVAAGRAEAKRLRTPHRQR